MKSLLFSLLIVITGIGYSLDCSPKSEVIATEERSVEQLEELAEKGDLEAMCEIAHCYLIGDGVKKDAQQSIKWWRKAAEQHNARAQFNLGVAYKNGDGVEKDLEQSFQWFKKAAEQNLP